MECGTPGSIDFGWEVREKQRMALYAERAEVQRPWGRFIQELSEE